MSAAYGDEDRGEIVAPCPNGPSREFFARGTCKLSRGSNGEGGAFSATPQRWNILTNVAHANGVGGVVMSSPKKTRVNPYTSPPGRSLEVKQGENSARKSSVHTSAADVSETLAHRMECVEADESCGLRRQTEDKETSDLPPQSLRIPSSWSTNTLGIKGNGDAISVSSGEPLASSSPDQLTPNSRSSPEDEESPTDAFIRRMHEDDDFGQSKHADRCGEGPAAESDSNSV